MNFAIQRHAFASAQRLDAGSGIVLYAMNSQQGDVAKSVSELGSEDQFEFVTAFVKRLVPAGESLLLVTETDVPPGSGLGGSGALGVAIVAAIDCIYGRERTPLETAAMANEIERKDLGHPGGDQDSLGAALGGLNFLEYHRGGGMTSHQLSISRDTLFALEHGSLLAYSGAVHESGSIHEDIKRSYAQENSPTVKAMEALRAQAQAMACSLESGDLAGYASSLNESCRQLYNLHESCDCADHRRFLQVIEDCILGGKTCGAGGGGFLLIYVKPGRRQECIRRVEELGGLVWPVTIDFEGVTHWLAPRYDDEEVQRFRHLGTSLA